MVFHHIGIACQDINLEIEKLKKIHSISNISDIIFDEYQNVNLCMITLNSGFKIEFVSGETVKKFINNIATPYHVCYECINIDKEIKKISSNGGLLVSGPKPAKLFNNRKVAFLIVSYGLIELLEK